MINQQIIIEEGTIKKKLDKKLVEILLNSESSTTYMLESIINGELTVNVHKHQVISKSDLPFDFVDCFNEEGEYLHRIMSLYYNGDVISDNVVYARMDSIKSNNLTQQLYEGKIPIGKLIRDTETRRKIISKGYDDSCNLQHMYTPLKLDLGIFPVKKYIILHDKQGWFGICEMFHSENISKHFWLSLGHMS